MAAAAEEEERRRCAWLVGERLRGMDEAVVGWRRGQGGCGGFCGDGRVVVGLDARAGEFRPRGEGKGEREEETVRARSNDFWNTEAPVFAPVDFCARGEARVGEGERGGERLSGAWDECEMSPLAEPRVEILGAWAVSGGKGEDGAGAGDADGHTDPETETRESLGLGDTSAPPATEAPVTAPTPQQSSRMARMSMGGARSCGDVRLQFLDTKWEGGGLGDGAEAGAGPGGWRVAGAGAVSLKASVWAWVGRKCTSLPARGRCGEGQGMDVDVEGGGFVGLRESREVDEVW